MVQGREGINMERSERRPTFVSEKSGEIGERKEDIEKNRREKK